MRRVAQPGSLLLMVALLASLATGPPAFAAPPAPYDAQISVDARTAAHAGRQAIARVTTPAPVDGDEFWSDTFGLPDVDGWVYCAIAFGDGFVMGGHFSHVGEVVALNIAYWDGRRWSTLGEGFDGDVLSLAVYRGELVAGGRFDYSGGDLMRGIARWTASGWAPVGGGLWRELTTPSLGATALATVGDALYAAGEFDRAGGVVARYVARWDGTAWSPLGLGLDAPALALLAEADSLYVGGTFDTAGTAPASGIAKWNGTSWSALGAGLTSTSGTLQVDAMVRYRGGLVATGAFNLADGRHVSNLASWNGDTWEAIGDFSRGELQEMGWSLAVRGDTLLIGASEIWAWDGAQWIGFEPNAFGNLNVLCETPAGLVVAGAFAGYDSPDHVAAVGVGLIRAGRWMELQSWSAYMHGLGRDGFVDVTSLASYRGDVVAAGYYRYAGSATGRVTLPGVASWDGAAWHPVGSPPAGNYSGLLADGDTLYLAGEFYPGSPVSRFDGRSWGWLGALEISPKTLARFQGGLYLGGRARALGTASNAGVHFWTGAAWEQVGSVLYGDDPGEVDALCVYGGRLVAGGSFTSISSVATHGIAAWNGHSWTPMDVGIAEGGVWALCECNGTLYAGGGLRDVSGLHGIMRWNGERWETLVETPAMISPLALGCYGTDVYAAGYVNFPPTFQNVGIARWDGTHWTPLGSGTSDAVEALLVDRGRLFLGGRFSMAGGRSSSGVAVYDAARERRDASALGSGTGTPNPFIGTTTVAYRLTIPGHVRAGVYDVRGRRVARIEDAFRSAGLHDVSWNGLDESGRSMPAGIYFVRLELADRTEVSRVVRLR